MAKNKVYSVVFILSFIFMLGFLVVKLPTLNFDSSILSLIPKVTEDKVDEKIVDDFTKRLDKISLVVIKPQENNLDVVAKLYQNLSKIEGVDKVIGKVDNNFQHKLQEDTFNFKTALINQDLREKLKGKTAANEVITALYSGVLGLGAKEFENDPLLLTRKAIFNLAKDTNFKVKQNYLTVNFNHEDYYLFTLIAKASGLNLEHTDNYVAAIDNAIETILLEYPESKIYKRGTVFYSKDAAKASKQDLTYLGSCTVLLVFLLIFAIFRTLNPVVLALLSVTFGLVAGSFLVVFCFNSINLIVIGMCLSIIGVVLDYSTYYLTLRLNFSGKETSFETIKRMQKPLIIAATTDVIAYLIILLFPLEPLKQLALFCIGAISYSCLFVVLVEPYLCQNTKKVALPLPTLLNQYLKLASKKTFSNTLIISLVVISAIGLFKLKANDDPALLQTLNPTLKQQDDFISKLLNTQNSQKFIIVSATSFEDLLYKNELVKTKLDKLIETKAIKSYKTLPFNSQKTQQQDLELLQSNTKVLQDKLSKMHLNLTFKDYQEQIFDEAKFFDSAYFKLYEQMLLAKNGTCALTIILNEVNNGALIKEALEPIENTLYLDRHEDLTHAFTYLRELISFVVLSFIVVIFVISCIRLKLRLGLLATVFSILALTTALTALAFSGLQLNLFSQLALILVLGIGINYAIFFTNNKEIEKVSLVAIATALLTTLLTIGILIFSSVAAIQGFAIVLSTGIIIAFLLATILKNYAK